MTKTLAAVLVASAFWVPMAVHGPVAEKSTDDWVSIVVEIPARTGAPTPPATPAPGGPGKDAGQPRPGALPATGGEIALGAGAAALVALAAGLVIRARRRRSV